jgi:hypothetical protein
MKDELLCLLPPLHKLVEGRAGERRLNPLIHLVMCQP